MRVVGPLLLLIVSVTLSRSLVAAYELSSFQEEPAAVDALKSAVADGLAVDKTFGRALIAEAMQRGWFDVVRETVDAGQANSVDLSSTVYQTAAVIRRHLQSLTAGLGNAKSATGIAPAFQWAQSPDSVFLNVKFAHKWDAPATLGCTEDKVNISSTGVLFEANCNSKRFRLHLDLNRDIDIENSTWSMAAVGRAMFTLRKETNSTWSRLLKGTKKPQNMHTWWAMHERYEDANDKLEDEEKAKVRREKKAAKEAAKASTDADDSQTTPSASATPTPSEAAPSEFEIRKAALTKEHSKKRKTQEAAHKTALSDIDSAARTEKKSIDDKAADSKKLVDDAAQTNRSRATAEHQDALDALKAELDTAIAALRTELGEPTPAPKDEL